MLDLSHNKIQVIPDSIGAAVGLAELRIAGNELTSVPESIGELQSLEILILS